MLPLKLVKTFVTLPVKLMSGRYRYEPPNETSYLSVYYARSLNFGTRTAGTFFISGGEVGRFNWPNKPECGYSMRRNESDKLNAAGGILVCIFADAHQIIQITITRKS
jgi:hypothetical protein